MNPCADQPPAIACNGIATAVPPHILTQSDAAQLAEVTFAVGVPDFEKMRGVFCNAGIENRYIAKPPEWYLQHRNWQERTDAFLDVATLLFCDVATEALERAGLPASAIDAVVNVSSTGIATPTLEARVADEIGFRTDCLRLPLFGLGCAGGVSGLSLAARLAQGPESMTVLLVVLELCSLAFRGDRMTKANVVATALFGDGAASAVISKTSDEKSITVTPGFEHRWPDTLNIMGWKVDPVGFEVVFDRAIPPFAKKHLRPVIERVISPDSDVGQPSTERLIFHPGGMKVLEAIESAFDLEAGSLDAERRVLNRYGNMSAPTALFVLRDALEHGLRGRAMLTALGPGFTASMVPLKAG